VDDIIDIPADVLSDIAKRNTMQVVLNDYLINKHAEIFKSNISKQKDYAVVFYSPEKAKTFPSFCFSDVRKPQIPEPDLAFFDDKEEAGYLLGTNPHSAMAWRYSPELELMY
jgi:hypothetical protein